MTTQSVLTIRTCLWRMICWTAGDAAVGALCSSFFGMIYGGLETLIHGDASRIILAAAYFSIVGAIAGALLGAFGAVLESLDAPERRTSASATCEMPTLVNPLVRDCPAERHRATCTTESGMLHEPSHSASRSPDR